MLLKPAYRRFADQSLRLISVISTRRSFLRSVAPTGCFRAVLSERGFSLGSCGLGGLDSHVVWAREQRVLAPGGLCSRLTTPNASFSPPHVSGSHQEKNEMSVFEKQGVSWINSYVSGRRRRGPITRSPASSAARQCLVPGAAGGFSAELADGSSGALRVVRAARLTKRMRNIQRNAYRSSTLPTSFHHRMRHGSPAPYRMERSSRCFTASTTIEATIEAKTPVMAPIANNLN
jgi:hypothetical protein